MDRTNTQHRNPHPSLTSIEDPQGAADSKRGASPCHWLSSAMALWLADDTRPQRLERLDRKPARPVR
jgi:hypothetical protein